jgi:hypothetical protein
MVIKSLEQENIFEEIKNGNGNLLINALAGTGKCLGVDTKILMYDSTYKNVQDIIVGDIIMGDDGTPRNVLSTTVGYDKLYRIELLSTGEYFICNHDHILSCYDKLNSEFGFLKKDVSVGDIINNKERIGFHCIIGYRLYRSNVNFIGSEVTDFYEYGCNFFENTDIKLIDIFTTVENRYLILSGIIDTYFYPIDTNLFLKDEYFDNKNIDLLFKLVRSVSFRIRYSKKKTLIYIFKSNFNKLNLKNKDYEYYFRYKPINYKNNMNNSIERFTITKVKNNGKYYGFTIDGNNRFVINDFIVTHNTTTIVNSLELIPEDKTVMMVAFNKHIANELKGRVPQRDNIRITTTHALGWGAIRRKYKNAVIDDDKAYKVINNKIRRWNMDDIDNVDEYINTIKKLVDLCRATLSLQRRSVLWLADKHSIKITDEDARRVLSVIEDMYNDTNTFDFMDMVYIPAIDKKIWLFPNDYVFVDECIAGDNKVITKRGAYKLKYLYDKFVKNKRNWMSIQDHPLALSFNLEENKFEYKKITKFHYKGLKWVTRIKLNRLTVMATPNHLFYTVDGWRETSDLRVGDCIKLNSRNGFASILPNVDQYDLLLSLCLCDEIQSIHANQLKLRFYVNKSDTRYNDFVTNLLDFKTKRGGNKYYHEHVTYNYHINSKLLDTEYIIKKINNKQLALLLLKNNKNIDGKIGFGIKSDTYDGALYISNLFKISTGSEYDVVKYMMSYYLFPIDQDNFFNKISQFIPNEFKDIIPEKYHNNVGTYQYGNKSEPEYYMTIIEIIENYRKKMVFDLTVEGNNNYFISGVENIDHYTIFENIKKNHVGLLTHNCQDYNKAQQFVLNKILKKDTGRLISVGDPHQCQPFNTKVLMFNGNVKNIQDIVVGDSVISFNIEDNKFIGINDKLNNVEEVSKRVINDNLVVIVSDNKISKYTKNHRCFVKYKTDDKIFEVFADDIDSDTMQMVHYNDNIIPLYKNIDNLYYEEYNNFVYSLKISKFETYIADGIMTHNSIYGFNGSDTSAFNWFLEKDNTKVLPLTTSFRCSKSVIEFAQNIVPAIRAKHDAEQGSVRNGSVLNEAKAGDFILSRKYKPLIVLLYDLLLQNKNASIRGNDIGNKLSNKIKKHKNFIDLNNALNDELNTKREHLMNLGVINVLNDPRYVTLLDNVEIIRYLIQYSESIGDLVNKISYIFTDTPDGIILSTIHKSKGLEADNVFIIRPDEIKLPTPIAELWEQEKNLEYIAYTRAKKNLIIDVEWTDIRN